MELKVLGRFGPFPAPGGACSGYTVRCGETLIALDLGNGCLPRLLSAAPGLDMDCVILSHLHADHMSDMLILRYALRQFAERNRPARVPMPVICPDGPEDMFRMLASSGVYDITTIRDNMLLRFGGVSISFHRVAHPVPTYATIIEHDGSRLVYTGDTGMFPGLQRICRGADLILADANFTEEDKPLSNAPHLSGAEAGMLAAQADARALILTHLWGGSGSERGTTIAQEKLLLEARAHFPRAELAEELKTYTV